MLFYCDTCPRKSGLNPNKYFAIYHTMKECHLVRSQQKYFTSDKVTEKISNLSSRKFYCFIIMADN
jgi:hypothetical protein